MTRFGALEFRGGMVLSSPAKDFGGWSALVMEPTGKSLLAVSDHGVSRVDQMTVSPATASVPAGPSNLSAVAGNGSVTLSWTGSTSGSPASYSIYRGTKSDGEATTPVESWYRPLYGFLTALLMYAKATWQIFRPGRRMIGLAALRSSTVDSIPTLQGPPSRT